jgi:hypothetical protein
MASEWAGHKKTKSYLDLASLLAAAVILDFLGRLLPKLPFHILPRLDLLSPLPMIVVVFSEMDNKIIDSQLLFHIFRHTFP